MINKQLLMIDISQAAAKEIERIKLSCEQPDSRLRLKIKSGGCSGLLYQLGLEEVETQEIESPSTDIYYKISGIAIVVDEKSLGYIQNLKLDYSEDLMGGGFRFQNPQAAGNCGCGLSFAKPN